MSSAKKIKKTGFIYYISKGTDNPKIFAKLTADGRESLHLEYYFGHKEVVDEETGQVVVKKDRRKESLKLYLWQAPRTPQERQQNRDTLELAQKIRLEKAQELLEMEEGYRLRKDRNINFLDYFQTYIDNYTKKDIRMIVMALNRFKDFLKSKPEYKRFTYCIKPEQIKKDMMVQFAEYLQTRSRGEGAKSCFQRFKKVINYALEHDVIRKNPCTGITIKVDDQILRKDVLSPDEMEKLFATHDPKQSNVIRRAFIFCLYCGLRYCDVKDLTFANIDYSNKLLKFEQNKTKGHSANSGVVIPLTDEILNLVGEPAENETKDNLIFKLPSHTMCVKSVQRWVDRAKINKHITWHCARHSFALNILNGGANIKTLGSLLGHSGLKHTEKYVRAVDSLKTEAINSLPKLNIANI